MNQKSILNDYPQFSKHLFGLMKQLDTAVGGLELYEFRYGLDNLTPAGGWGTIEPLPAAQVEQEINQRIFYTNVHLKPQKNGKIVLDEQVLRLTRMLLAGLFLETYTVDWVKTHFYFDIRGFIFIPRTIYFTAAVLAHFSNTPYQKFEAKQPALQRLPEIGYKDYSSANAELDAALLKVIEKTIAAQPKPLLITLAGPTAAGKTEIVARVLELLHQAGYSVTSIEMDNFFKDKDYRDQQSEITRTFHYDLFKECLREILQGRSILMPQYDFYKLVSSHDEHSQLRLGKACLEVHPADIIFLEGNFPFHLPDIAEWIGIKIVYLADDEYRLKRKWLRDIDLRKKYDPNNFLNRYFRSQYLRAEEIYRPLMEVADIVVDTSGAKLWISENLQKNLNL